MIDSPLKSSLKYINFSEIFELIILENIPPDLKKTNIDGRKKIKPIRNNLDELNILNA